MLFFTSCQKWPVSASCTIDHCDKSVSLSFLSIRPNKHWDFVHLLNHNIAFPKGGKLCIYLRGNSLKYGILNNLLFSPKKHFQQIKRLALYVGIKG